MYFLVNRVEIVSRRSGHTRGTISSCQTGALDGSLHTSARHLVLGALFEPTDADAQLSSDAMISLLQQWAAGFLEGLVSTPAKEHLTALNGTYAPKQVTKKKI